MGSQHAYELAARLEQMADHPLTLNQAPCTRVVCKNDGGRLKREPKPRDRVTDEKNLEGCFGLGGIVQRFDRRCGP